MSFWKDKKVLVTGGGGFIGSHLTEMLLQEGARVRVADGSEEKSRRHLGSSFAEVDFSPGDLSDLDVCLRACRGMDCALHLAAHVGGVGYNAARPGALFYANVVMNANVMEAAVRSGVERYLCVSSACVYPRESSVPTPEDEGFLSDPEPTNLGYGWAKRVAEAQGRCYALQYPMRIAIARPYNAYGPRDNFQWESSHVIPALIRKVVEKQDPLTVWGDGEQSRAFVYVTDVARGLLLAVEKYPEADPVNIGAEEEITIKELIALIAELAGESPRIVFDPRRPSGQMRRQASTAKAESLLGYEAAVSLREGLQRTIEWYRRNSQ
jgi:GDP-L-fucose synthase